ncbi:hypothetical protein BDY24DRAFT_367712 [Mrakia frigida]|uniref:uncharacterized protein n=1 Tax=Mrakia frigida TaxID=29902 RepID=UPI003FCBFD15
MSSSFGNYAFPPPSLPAPILTNGGSRKNSFAGLSLSTPTSPSFSSTSKIFHALPSSSNNNRRRSSNPIVYGRKRSRTAFFFLFVLLVGGWFLFRREVEGGLDAASAISGAFLKQGKEGERVGRIRMKEMRQELMDQLSGSPRRSPSSNHRVAGSTHPVGTTTDSSLPPPPLTNNQELSALLLFLSSSSTNVLPSTIDPSAPLNPDHVLSHSLPLSSGAREAALKEMEKEAWTTWPVVLVGREGDFWTKEARDLLSGERYFGKKQEGLGLVYIDRRPDTLVLTPLLTRLTSTTTLPSVLIGGVPVGGFEHLKILHDSNKLAGILTHAGATIGRDLEERKIKERRIALAKRQQGK